MTFGGRVPPLCSGAAAVGQSINSGSHGNKGGRASKKKEQRAAARRQPRANPPAERLPRLQSFPTKLASGLKNLLDTVFPLINRDIKSNSVTELYGYSALMREAGEPGFGG